MYRNRINPLFTNGTAGFFLILATIFVACSSTKQNISKKTSASIPTIDQVGALHLPEKIVPVKAPFDMPQLKRPVFPALSLSITQKGAKEGVKATKEIQATIDEVNSRGGGMVIIPKGKWFTGRISLKSNVNLHFEDGAELSFSGEVEDYRPAVFTRNEGVEVMSVGACIYANNQENIAITGKGRLIGPAKGGSIRKQIMKSDVIEKFINASTPVSQRIFEGYNGGEILPPMFISPTNCKNVLIEGISLEDTAFWNIVPVYCDGVIIRGITVNSVGIPRGDGIDIESSKNVLIEYSTLSCGDDCFTIKAGRGEDGIRVNKPSENIVVRYCLAREGHGGITVGSETAGMIRNLYMHDCVFDNTGIGVRFKTRRPRGGGGENLYYERIRMNLTGAAFRWDMLGGTMYVGDLANRLPARAVNSLTPVFRNIVARDIQIDKSTQFVSITSIPESPLKNVLIENANVKADDLFKAADVDGFTVKNATIVTKNPVISLLDTRNMLFENVKFDGQGKELEVKLSGGITSDDVRFKNCNPAKPKGWKE